MGPNVRDLVERFYAKVWNEADQSVGREIVREDFRFRGSLGPELGGRETFFAYLDAVHAALGEFKCEIDDLIVAGDRAAARMTFRGLHRGRLFGVAPTGEEISWTGAAFFRMVGGQIGEVWVLGDLDHLKAQLKAETTAAFKLDESS